LTSSAGAFASPSPGDPAADAVAAELVDDWPRAKIEIEAAVTFRAMVAVTLWLVIVSASEIPAAALPSGPTSQNR